MRRAVLVLAVLWAVGAWLPGDAAGEKKPLFRVGTHVSTFGSMDTVADRKGYFTEVFGKGGYTVQVFSQGKLMLEALLANSLDTGFVAARPFISTVSQKGRVVGIGVNSLICKTQTLTVRQDSPIRSLADLRGKKVGTKVGSSENFMLTNLIFPSAGIPQGGWTPVNTTNTERVPALRAKAIDAAVVEDPTLSLAELNGWIRRVIPDFCAWDNTPMLQIANPRTLKDHSDLYVKYYKVWFKAVKLLREDPDEYARVYTAALTERGAKFEFKLVRRLLDGIALHPKLDAPIFQYLNKLGKGMLEKKDIKRLPDFDGGEAVNTKLLDQAMRELGVN